MIQKNIFRLFFSVVFLFSSELLSAEDIPHLQQGQSPNLIVNGSPFIILGGELGNSSASNTDYMKSVWPKLTAMHLNTLLAPIYWDLLEPKEGEYDFTLVKDLIMDARKNNIKLVLLWFGSWKNSMSTYTPSWVKRDSKRFELVRDQDGNNQQILTPFGKENLQADIRAYTALLSYVKKIDQKDHTVLMIQVENEIGMLPSARDYQPKATLAFHESVPKELMTHLQKNKSELQPSLAQLWSKNSFKMIGSWEEIFGKSLATDEIFIAWHLASYAQKVAAAGKAIYPLPTFVNAALNRPGVAPGKYPSGGPLPHLFDIWKAATPDINLLSPDFYNPDFTHWNDLYTSKGETLFIPEIRAEKSNAAKVFYSIGRYGAIGFSPFSIESTEKPEQEPIGKAYAEIQPLIPAISLAKQTQHLAGALVDKANPEAQLKLGNTIFIVKHDNTLGWTDDAKNDVWPESGVMIVQRDAENFWISGTGVVITVKNQNHAENLGIDFIYEGNFKNGQWQRGRNLNGDQNHQGRHIRIPLGEIATQEVRLYSFSK